jgi:hypothetical protein
MCEARSDFEVDPFTENLAEFFAEICDAIEAS